LSLEDRWRIGGPGVKAYPSREADKSSPNACGTCSSPLAFQIEYVVSQDVKYAYYQIFKKDCKEVFEDGKEIVKGTGVAVERNGNPNLYKMTLSNIDTDNQLASVEFVPTEASAISWWSSMMFWKTQPSKSDEVLEFCIRMGLWLPPEAGDIEVNFRETNVIAAYKDTPMLTESGLSTKFRRVELVVLDPLPMNPVAVTVFGNSLKSEEPVCEGEECGSSQAETREENEKEQDDNNQEKDEL
jgi:hypothetical protein